MTPCPALTPSRRPGGEPLRAGGRAACVCAGRAEGVAEGVVSSRKTYEWVLSRHRNTRTGTAMTGCGGGASLMLPLSPAGPAQGMNLKDAQVCEVVRLRWGARIRTRWRSQPHASSSLIRIVLATQIKSRPEAVFNPAHGPW